MISNEIFIPRISRSESLGLQLYHLLQLQEEINTASDSNILLNWSDAEDSLPGFIVPFSAFIADKVASGKSFKNTGKYLGINHYLRSMCFSSGTFDLKISEDLTTTPICKFDNQLPFNGSDLLVSKLNGQMEFWIAGNPVLSGLKYVISELVDNIVEHSRSEFGWIGIEYDSDAQTVDVALVDTGIGLLESYLGNRFLLESHVEGLDQALKGISTKSIGERGFGLRTSIKTVLNGTEGEFVMISGNAIYQNGEIAETEHY